MKIIVLSGKGGVGKSMLTSSLAMLFAEKHKVVAVDCDVDAPNLGIWLGGVKRWDKTIPVIASEKPRIDHKQCKRCGLCAKHCRFGAIKMINERPKINTFLCEGCGLCEIICPQKAIKLEPVQNGEIKIKKTKYGFFLISGRLFPGETGSGKIVDKIKSEAEKYSYDLMIIDSAPGTGCPVISALKDADFAVLISEPTHSGFSDLKKALRVVNHFNVPWALVINKWNLNSKISNEMERWVSKKFLNSPRTAFKGKVLGKISYDKNIFRAISGLNPIMKTNLKAKEEIKKIFNNLKLWLDQ
ncbi:ATP-binding protein [bacterium]|nr:ATP-binding protein [bacterium]